jgi:hypothetical protein
MSFFDHLRPKWRHSDPLVRAQAVALLDDQAVLATIAREDLSERVRAVAVGRLNGQEVLAGFAQGSSALAIIAMQRLTDRAAILRLATNAELARVRELAVDRIEDGALLHRLAAFDVDSDVRVKARTRSPFPHPVRDFLRVGLARLAISAPPAAEKVNFTGTLEEVCAALIGDSRFSINGGLDASATSAAETSERILKLVAQNRVAAGSAAPMSARLFYQIQVWRTAENAYGASVEEKR